LDQTATHHYINIVAKVFCNKNSKQLLDKVIIFKIIVFLLNGQGKSCQVFWRLLGWINVATGMRA
jgi:hypothetical protein